MTIEVNGFDFHCHVDLFPDPAALIADCDRNRIVTLAVTTTPKAWTQNRRWTERSNFVFPAIGLRPELADQRRAEIALVEQLMAETPFIGEVELDGSPPHHRTPPIQKEVFSRAPACSPFTVGARAARSSPVLRSTPRPSGSCRFCTGSPMASPQRWKPHDSAVISRLTTGCSPPTPVYR